MNGVHDMGGQHGLGPIVPEPEGSPFHAAWEARVHAVVIASPTRGNIDDTCFWGPGCGDVDGYRSSEPDRQRLIPTCLLLYPTG